MHASLTRLQPRAAGADLSLADLAAGLRHAGPLHGAVLGGHHALGVQLLESLRGKGYVLTAVQHGAGSAGHGPAIVLRSSAQDRVHAASVVVECCGAPHPGQRHATWGDIVMKPHCLDDMPDTLHVRTATGAQARRWRMFAVVDRTHLAPGAAGSAAALGLAAPATAPAMLLLPAVQRLRESGMRNPPP